MEGFGIFNLDLINQSLKMSLPQALKSQFTKSFHYHRENYPEEDYSTTFENCMNNTEFGEGNLIAFEELFDELWIAQWED